MMVEGASLWELVERRSSASPERLLAVDEAGRSLTFGGYRAACEQAAAGLAERGVTAGAIVSWQLPSWLESFVLMGALARLGAVQNPILPIYRAREVRFVVGQLRSGLLIVPSTWRGFAHRALADEIASDQPGLAVLVADRELPAGDPAHLPPPPATAGDQPVRWVFYTSGTTADPKGVRHTDATVIAAAMATVERLRIGPDDRGAIVFPVTHIGGALSLVGSLVTGSAFITLEAFEPDTSIPVLARERVTLGNGGTPFHLAYLQAQRRQPSVPLFPAVRAFPGGGAPKPPELHRDVKRELGGVGVVSGYGLTECPALSMSSVDDPDDKLANTEGRPNRGVEVRVVRLDGAPAEVGEEGELRVRGPMLFKGYWDASLDEEAFDDKGFLRTGDLGHQDEDGFLVITGRVKDIIIRKGENISAKELEDLLYTHPRIADVAIIGLPDPELGERCCAVVAPVDPADPVTFEDMSAFLRGHDLMVQKLPEQLEIVDAVPRNPTGKILKHLLRERFG